ncbi:pseudouridine synthase [Hydrogenophaga sp. PBL-H3]|uniref:pseudouridine synthase n=1 Tax=Hydrogenophaga sp. PBL-H3 TaxID=434010 RepID=UPI00131FB6C3|nr:pseudouridine synthase [Hydrogenophaga sp. PBL-H3]QHE77018.1 pseudouridine synthase [Hydrogenophaga sp. PBL-H3]QHE81442.1 pseudouridine synthase [Hydrogenophaga sp. PBL-H3]
MARPPKHPQIPARHGVSPSCVALPHTRSAPWTLLLDYLAERLSVVDRAAWADRLARGEVLDDTGQPLPPDAAFQPGARIHYYRHLDDEPAVPFEETVLFQDAHLLVADKPHFLPVTPGGRFVQQSLLVRLKRRTGIDTLSPVHRIDRETAGLVLFSVRPTDRNAYQALFRDRVVHKTYEAIAPHLPALVFPLTRRSRIEEDGERFFRMVEAEGEPNSETLIERTEVRGAWARYTLSPVTGKRHQLRVHMNALGAPIVGDQFYPQVLRGPDDTEDFAEPLQLLARGIAFTDPVTGMARRFESGRALAWPGD